MTVKWHCRTCDKRETSELELEHIIKERTGEATIQELIICCLEAKHQKDCSDPNIGIRST